MLKKITVGTKKNYYKITVFFDMPTPTTFMIDFRLYRYSRLVCRYNYTNHSEISKKEKEQPLSVLKGFSEAPCIRSIPHGLKHRVRK